MVLVEPGARRQRIERMGVLDLHDLVDTRRRVHYAVGVHTRCGQARRVRRPSDAGHAACMMLPQVVGDVGALVLRSAQAIALDVLGIVRHGQELVRVGVANRRDEVALFKGSYFYQLVRSQLINVNLIVLM